MGRKPASRSAVMLLDVDEEISEPLLSDVLRIAGVRDARRIGLG